MSFIAAVTQPSWIATLRLHGYSGEVNFWRPGKQPVSSNHYGEPVLFIQKGRTPRLIAGFGVIHRYELLTLREAWVRWRYRNGVTSLDEFVERVSSVAKTTSTNSGGTTIQFEGADTKIGCVVLRNLFFFPEGKAPTVDLAPFNFPRNVVSYKSYSSDLNDLLLPYAAQAPALQNEPATWLSQVDPVERDEIEKQAMAVAEVMFHGWEIINVSRPETAQEHVGIHYPGYDILVRRSDKELHIEVKGTKLGTPVITITRNELQAAASDPATRLLVVRDIQTHQDQHGWHAGGGIQELYRWAKPDAIKAIVEGANLGAVHSMHLKSADWSLGVHTTDLLESCSAEVLS